MMLKLLEKIMFYAQNTTAPTPAPGQADHELAGLAGRLAMALRIGMVRGLVALLDQSVPEDATGTDLTGLARDCIGQDILVVAGDRTRAGLATAGLDDYLATEAAGTGLAEFCAVCAVSPVLACPGPAAGPLVTLCRRLAAELGVTVTQLPVICWGTATTEASPELPVAPRPEGATDPRQVAAVISRRITARRLAMGLNDRFDGSVYS